MLFFIQPISIPPERFSQGSDLLGFPKIIPEIRLRFFWGKVVPRKSTLRLPGLKRGVRSGLILSGALNADLKSGVGRRRTYQLGGFVG
jgi:hypothetical protein